MFYERALDNMFHEKAFKRTVSTRGSKENIFYARALRRPSSMKVFQREHVLRESLALNIFYEKNSKRTCSRTGP